MPVKRTAHRRKKIGDGSRVRFNERRGVNHRMRVDITKRNLVKPTHNKHRHTVRNSKPAITVGLIYANWCTHCQHLKPEWKKMKKGMRGMNCHYLEIEDSDHHKDRKIAHVNSRLKGEKLVANGYPTIFRIKGGYLDYYQGERTAPALQQWFKGGSPLQQQEIKKEPTLMEQMFGGQKGGCDCDKNTGLFKSH